MRNTISYDAENLALENIYGAKSGKESIMDQVLDVAYVNYTLYEFKELVQILGDFMFVDNCKVQ